MEETMYIKEAMAFAINEDGDRGIVANKLGITKAMVSHYINQDNTPRLPIAGKIWGEYGLVIEPFTERAVIKDWTRQQEG